MTFTQDDIIRILDLLDQSSYEELDLQSGDFRLQVSKSGGARVAVAPAAAPGHPAGGAVAAASAPAAAPQVPAAAAPQAPATAAPSAPAVDTSGLLVIAAPMLGAFYRAPKPGDPNFVEVGSIVDETDTVCLIEVMKTYTTVPAGIRGRVVKILAENTDMVEHQQPLFLIEPL